MHLKRNNIGKFWPVPRKGTKYLAVAMHNKKDSIPLIVIARDLLKIVRNKKELKRILNEKKIKINNKEIREINYPVCLSDVVTLPDAGKNYRAILSKNKKMQIQEITDKEAERKIFKVIGKKILAGKKIQLNLSHGVNILSKEKTNIGDSVILSLKDKKIIKIIKKEGGKKALIIKGKHAGFSGKIEEIVYRGGKEIAKITSDKGRINVWTKNLIIAE